MEIGDIISQALRYPLNDTTAFFKVAAMYLLLVVPTILITVGALAESSGMAAIGIILLVVCYIIFLLIMSGFHVSVLKEGIDQSGLIPPFNITKNIVDTFKVIVLSFVYGIIPAVIVTILFFILGVSAPTTPGSSSGIFGAGVAIVFIVSIILYIVFGLLLLVGMLRFANTDSLSEGLSFSEVLEDIKGIGVGKIIVTWVILGIIASVIMVVGALLSIIPIIGIVILMFFIMPYIFLAIPYGCGLLYSEIA